MGCRRRYLWGMSVILWILVDTSIVYKAIWLTRTVSRATAPFLRGDGRRPPLKMICSAFVSACRDLWCGTDQKVKIVNDLPCAGPTSWAAYTEIRM